MGVQLPEKEEKDGISIHNYLYVPFSNGPNFNNNQMDMNNERGNLNMLFNGI